MTTMQPLGMTGGRQDDRPRRARCVHLSHYAITHGAGGRAGRLISPGRLPSSHQSTCPLSDERPTGKNSLVISARWAFSRSLRIGRP
jgi:hypothetical protein